MKNSVIAVENLDESAKFYTEILGLEEVRKFSPRPGLTIAFYKDEGEATIELIEGEEGKKGIYMVGIEVDDMDAEIAKLKNKGVVLTRGPFGEPGGPKIAFLDGPDGVEIELIEP
ncbi:MAG: VOC family protein [Methanobacterium sp.]|nr:VOC family protein [Methanobacterium sp.]